MLIHRLLVLVRSVLNLLLDISTLDCSEHSAHGLDLFQILARPFFNLVGQRLDVIRSRQRINRLRGARLIGNDLLSPQRNPRRLLRRQRQCFIKRIRMQRLRSTQDRRHRLDRRPHNIVLRLLRGQS